MMKTAHYLHFFRFSSLLVFLVALMVLAAGLIGCQRSDNDPIKIGILHSLSGTMATSEKPVVDAVLLAIEEINAKGGLLGRKLVAVIADGKSDDATFAVQAERLITEEKVAVVFGCWTSSCRKTVKPIFEQHDSLLFYPVQYEGLEESANIIYTGATPNQQIIPAISWAAEHLGKRLYLVGSDYVFPRVANWMIKKQARLLGLEIVGESYLPLGATDVGDIIAAMRASQADVIINTINGDSNYSFFHAYAEAGISAAEMPVISFSLGESELDRLGAGGINMAGHYAVWSYFQSMESPQNQQFIQRFKHRFGAKRTVSDPMVAAFFGVQLWAQAVNIHNSTNIHTVLNSLTTQSLESPEGIVAIDFSNHHAWRSMRIGQINTAQQFHVVWDSGRLIPPSPYPLHILPAQGQALLEELFNGWGGAWSAPVHGETPAHSASSL